MRISKQGIEFIKKEEGGCVLKAYKCQAGVWTIGYGSTSNVKSGDKITLEEAEELLRKDLKRFEDCVSKYITVPLKQHEFDSLVSFAFNVGCGAFKKSTLVKKINSCANMDTIAAEYRKWRRGGGKVLPILVARREREIKLFQFGKY